MQKAGYHVQKETVNGIRNFTLRARVFSLQVSARCFALARGLVFLLILCNSFLGLEGPRRRSTICSRSLEQAV